LRTAVPFLVVFLAVHPSTYRTAGLKWGDRRLNFHESRDNLTPRAGVPQGEQPHVFLFRGLLALEELLPGSRQELLDHGAVPFDTGELPWLAEPGWLPVGQDGFEVLSATRPLFEYVIRCRVQELPGVQIRAGSKVINLRRCDRRWEVGLADRSTVLADLVVDASGRSSRLPASTRPWRARTPWVGGRRSR
jgi:hypothetical protein